jgi:uncharacterized membrane protein
VVRWGVGYAEKEGGIAVDARLPKLLFVLMVAFAAVYFSSVYAKLPEVVASHFNASGRANGWQPKTEFLTTFIVLNVIPTFLVFGVPAIIRVLPPVRLNVPNKQYWMSEERVGQMQNFLTGWFAWFGCAVYGMMLYVFHYVIQWNLHAGAQPSGDSLIWGIGVFGMFTVVWVLRVVLHFARKAAGGD